MRDPTDSWIEVSSHPSDSYTSSSDEHIITAGLRVSDPRRRKKRRGTFRASTSASTSSSKAGPLLSSSSDDDDEDGEEEEAAQDLGSLIHEMALSSSDYNTDSGQDDSDDEDSGADSRTVTAPAAAARVGRTVFTSTSTRDTLGRPAAFHHAADHDAALRASLSTLLSCAKAARGLGIARSLSSSPPSVGQGRVEGVRVLREGELPVIASSSSVAAEETEVKRGKRTESISSSSITTNSISTSSASAAPVSSITTRRPTKSSKLSSKSRKSRPDVTAAAAAAAADKWSPANVSLLTIAFSAGAVVLLTAISFSAGYALGKEIGHATTGGSGVDAAGGVLRGKGEVVRRFGRVVA